MRHVHIDFTHDEVSFGDPGITVDPDGDGYAETGPGICIQTETIEIALTWNQAEALWKKLGAFFKPEDGK